MYFLLAYRQSYFVVQGKLEGPYPMNKGTGQGSVLSPTLFNLYLSNLPSTSDLNVETLCFADDVVLICRGPDLDSCLLAVEEATNRISNYLSNRSLEISPEKSHLVIFSKKIFNPSEHSIHINGTNLQAEETTKFLGMTLDYRFSLSPHILNVAQKGAKIISLIKSLRKTWHGPDPRNLITFYRGLLRSSIEYGSHILRYSNYSHFEKLVKLQYKALRLALGLRNSTPTNVILAEAAEPPLHIRISQLSDRYIMRTLSLSEHLLIDKLYTLQNILNRKPNGNIHNIRTDFPVYKSFTRLIQHRPKIHTHALPTPYQFPFSLINSSPNINTTIGLLVKSAECKETTLQEELSKENLESHTQIYTDGSNLREGSYVGYSSVIPSHDIVIKHRISSYASIFTAEALAILTSLRAIRSNNLERVVILTDSLSVLVALRDLSFSKTKSHIIYQILELWSSLTAESKEIAFVWVPSHVGIPGNELADLHAKQAINDASLQNTPIPQTDFRESITRRMKDRTSKLLRIQSASKGSHYFKKFYRGWKKPWFEGLKMDRPQITTINRMRSNHFNLNQSLQRKNIINSALCECSQIESLSHVFWFCPKYTVQRDTLIKSLKKLNIKTFNINKLIENPTAKIAYILHNYLKSIGKNI